MIGRTRIVFFVLIFIKKFVCCVFFYSSSNPDDILRFFGPMKIKIANLYDQLQTATCNGNIREVLKIEEKLKLLRYE